jgi:hypothetical protein
MYKYTKRLKVDVDYIPERGFFSPEILRAKVGACTNAGNIRPFAVS